MRPGSWCFFARSSPRSLILSSVPGGGYRSRSATITSFLDVRGLRFTRVSLKVIRRIDFADLPKTISGKIRRVELRDQEEHRQKDGDGAARGVTEFWEEDFPGLKA